MGRFVGQWTELSQFRLVAGGMANGLYLAYPAQPASLGALFRAPKAMKPSINRNIECYEALAGCYDDIYGIIDAHEAVRQWMLLLGQLGLFPQQVRKQRLLDIGCGLGWYLEAWNEQGFDVTGLDASPAMLARAGKRLAEAGKTGQFIEADIRIGLHLPEDLGFDFAVSHFNFPNLFAPRERDAVFRTVAKLVRPGGVWMADFSDPDLPVPPVDEVYRCGESRIHRTGAYNSTQNFYEQHWVGQGIDCTEHLWFGFRKQAQELAEKTGWRILHRAAWLPYLYNNPWRVSTPKDTVFADVYQRLGGSIEEDGQMVE